MKRVALTLALAALALTAAAREPQTTRAAVKVAAPSAAPDFLATLKKTGLKYETDKDGDYKIEVSWNEEKRSQVLFLRGKPAEVQKEKMRELWSFCWKGERPDAALMEKVLTARYKAGAFQMEKEGDSYYIYFRLDLPEDVKSPLLARAINLVAEIADDMEKEVMEGKDDF